MKTTIRILKRLLIIIMIILLLNNFMMSSIVNASDPPEDPPDSIQEKGQGFFTSFLGLLTLPARAIALGIGYAINALAASVAYIEGATEASVETRTITPFDIFFNKVKILDINFFNIGSDVNIVNTIRTGIAAWYYALRLIAMAILLVILIYVGIRMAISTVATDKAMYKRMLVDWVVSLILIFLTNYIIIFVITVNNNIVGAIEKGVQSESIEEVYETIRNLGFDWIDIDSIPATIIYCMLVAQTFGLLITYFNRMLKVAFLIIIAPLITLTYAVDKMGDGKAQALGNWIKEFIFTVLTQVFHCIMYMSLINVSMSILIERSGKGIKHGLAAAVMAILCVNFVRTAEGLIRKILMHNHQDNSLSVAGGMAATAVALQKSKSLGTATRKAVNVTKSNLKTAKRAMGVIVKSPVTAGKAISTSLKTRSAMKEFMSSSEGKKIEAGMKKPDKNTYKNASKETRKEMKNQRATYKLAKKLKKAEIKAEQREKVNATVKNSAISRAGRKIVSPIGRVKNFKHKLNRIASQSSSYQAVSGIVKAYTATGVGVVTGSMMYGVTGKAGQAIGMSVAGYQMHRAFQKSALTMEAGTQSSLIGMGAQTKEEAFKILHDVASNPVLYDGESQESMQQAEALLKAIGDQLIHMVGNPEYKSQIRNELDAMVKKNPEAISSTINKLVQETAKIGMTEKYRDNPDEQGKFMEQLDTSGLTNACQAYADFAGKKEIYNQMKNAQAMGISKDSYVEECIEGFVETSKVRDTVDGMIEKGRESQNDLNAQAMDMKPKMFDAVSDVVEERRKFIEDAIRFADENEKKNLEEQLRDLARVEEAMSDAIIRDKDKALRESQKKLLQQVKKDCEKEISDLVKEVERIEKKPGYQRTKTQTRRLEEHSTRRIKINNKIENINDILNSNI